jgi:regulatory protein YycI of two-component signal transduction system YycFG
MNKKLISLFIFVILISGIFLVSSLENKGKTSDEVYRALENNDDVRVVVKIEGPAADKGILIKTKKADYEISLEKQEIKEEIINDVGEKNIKHVFEDSIAVEISKEDLNELNKNPNIKFIIID